MEKEKIRVYLANGLFSRQEQLYNDFINGLLVKEFGSALSIYVPQNNQNINDKNECADSIGIFNADNEYLDNSDLIIAILDGQTPDVGLATEVGRASALGIPVIGLYTDVRQQGANNIDKLQLISQTAESQFPYVNLYLVGAIKSNGTIVNTEESLLTEVAKVVENFTTCEDKNNEKD